MLLLLFIILLQKKLCQVVIWVLRIPQKSFCIQNVHIDTDKNKIWVKILTVSPICNNYAKNNKTLKQVFVLPHPLYLAKIIPNQQ